MPYLPTVNTPGYQPMDEDPPVFETAAEAWTYLAEDRAEALSALENVSPDLRTHALWSAASDARRRDDGDPASCGSLIAAHTPGYEGDHDLGIAYTVTLIEGELS